MLYINKLTNNAQQQVILTGIPGYRITMTLRYMPRIQQWIMGMSLPNGFNAQGITVVTGLNLLRQFREIIPFGITCIREDGLDPSAVNDFRDQVANLYLLNAEDVAQMEKDWFT